MRAIGKPVALEASADDRDTRGFISIIRDAATGAAESERRPDDRWKARRLEDRLRLVVALGDATCRDGEANPVHRLGEQPPIFGDGDGFGRRPDQLHAVLLEDAI